MRNTVMLSTAALTVALLAACSPGAAPATDASAGGDGASSQAVSVWYLADAVGVDTAIARFEAANPGVTVDAQPYANDQYKTKLKIALGTPNGPDVFHTWGGGEFGTYVGAGQVTDLTSFVADSGLQDSIGGAALAVGEVGSKPYAVPVTVEASMVWYNTEIFATLDLTPPTTWADFLSVIKATKDAGYVPLATANKARWPGTHWWSELVAQTCGPEFVAKASAGEASFDDECVVKAHAYLQELVDAGAFNEGFNGLDYDSGESRQLFWSGKAAMNHMGNWTVSSAAEEAPDMLAKMAMFTVPAVPDAKVSNKAMTGGMNLFAVSKSAANSKLALELLSELTGEQAAQDIADGGRIPVYSGVALEDPLLQSVADAIAAAPSFTLWPDQFLDPSVAEVLLTNSQAVFGKEKTPVEAATALQEAQDKVK